VLAEARFWRGLEGIGNACVTVYVACPCFQRRQGREGVKCCGLRRYGLLYQGIQRHLERVLRSKTIIMFTTTRFIAYFCLMIY
jgi:hypothetical protein